MAVDRSGGGGFYSREELLAMNFRNLGENVLIDRLTPIYCPDKISLGSNVRIGSFCILSGDICIGNYVHIASYVFLNGGAGIEMRDFSSVSSGVKVFTQSSDFKGEGLVVPLVDEKYRKDIKSKIIFEKHSVVGANSVILPGAYLAEGVAVGAMSLLMQPTKPFGIYFGIPAKRISERSRNILELEKAIYKDGIKYGEA
ncbi:acyltransferase [Helicobacter apodemus]|uniref:Chloramphenicol acetyltransferase n=1 Tax=Helicobacter apodemus TaxID=135569 RepID=A0A2U8FB94_9HELI|nr:O-acetyltransferase [Helicobacter apodemus]AWI33416.1 O-acetyltransferase [Helicobacter apodemus]